jgi:hypothetical protein
MNEPIINGIDVSECCCFENNRCLWSKRYYENNNVAPPCEAVKNCYFKQLKCLEQENKELKHRNKNLKLALSTYEMPEVVKVLTDWRTGELQLQENKLNKYKQAIEEIRSYCDEQNIKADYTACYCYITNKIDEVLNDNQ